MGASESKQRSKSRRTRKNGTGNNPNVTTMCRLCGSIESKDTTLLSLYTYDKEKTAIVNKIRDITGNRHKISFDDGLPQQICTNCFDNVRRCSKFVESYVHSYRRQRELFSTGESDSDDDDDEEFNFMSENSDSDCDVTVPTIGHNSNLVGYRCKLCLKWFFVKDDFAAHRCGPISGWKKCSVCFINVVDNEELESHMVECHTKSKNDLIGKKPYKCEKCSLTFKTRLVYHLHVLDHSWCEKCDTKISAYKKHICTIWENGEKLPKYECNECTIDDFENENLLENHKNEKHKKTCEKCKKTYKHKDLHKVQHVITDLNLTEMDFVEKKDSSTKLTCKICNANFKLELNYKFHVKKHSGNLVGCEICKFKTASFKVYKDHQKEHNK